jgi:hypothetical protein
MLADGAMHMQAVGRGATPVAFSLGSSDAFAAGQWCLYTATVIWVIAGLALQESAPSLYAIAVQVAAACLVCGFVGAASLRLHRANTGAVLVWTGDFWQFQPVGAVAHGGSPGIALDMGTGLILVWTPESPQGRGQWVTRSRLLLVEQQMDRDRWALLRRALYQCANPRRSH